MKSKSKRRSLVLGQNNYLNGKGSDWALLHANKHVTISRRLLNFLF